MKKNLFVIAVLLFSFQAWSQSGPLLVWDKATHEFGEVAEGAVVSHTFQFTNKGKEPLILTAVQPTWKKRFRLGVGCIFNKVRHR